MKYKVNLFLFRLFFLVFGYAHVSVFACLSNSQSFESYHQSSLDSLNQNKNKKFVNITNMVNVNGQVNFDIKPKTMQKSMPGEGEDYFALSNVLLSYRGALQNLFSLDASLAYYKNNKGQGDYQNNTGLFLDEAYITIANFNKTPFFAQVGKMYLPFGKYDRLKISPTLVQMLTVANANSMHFGFINYFYNTIGITTSFYFSQGTVTHDPNKIQGDINGGGASVIKYVVNDNIALSVGAQYIYNMLNINAMREGGAYQLTTQSYEPKANVYKNRTDGVTSQFNLHIYCFDMFFNYVTALERTNDLIQYRTNPVNEDTGVKGAKPSAWELGASSNVMILNFSSSFDFVFQRSYETAGLFVFNALPINTHPFPETRYILGFNILFYKHAYLRIQWGHNFLYKQGHGDTGRQGDDATIRLGLFT